MNESMRLISILAIALVIIVGAGFLYYFWHNHMSSNDIVTFNAKSSTVSSSQEVRESPVGSIVEGQIAPNFSFKDRAGRQFSLSDFRGKVVLINFWATWCPPCREEMPSLDSLLRQMDEKQFVILAFSVDNSWGPIDEFMSQGGFKLPVYADFDKQVSTRYGTFKFPETYVLDKNGKVVLKIIGSTDWMAIEMLDYLQKLILNAGS
jgi:peroxiredoxin